MAIADWGGFAWGEGPWGGAPIATLRERRRAHIVWLVEVALLGVGAPVLYFSDRNIDHMNVTYERYIQSVSGIDVELMRATSDSLNSPVSITFRNGKWRALDFLIEAGETNPFEGAPVTVKAVHLDDEKNPTDAETIFVGILEEPRQITRRDFTCMASSVEFFADLRR